MSSPPYSKRDVLRFLLEQGQPVRILLDARREGVEVPPRFRGTPQLILEIGYRMNPPIPDLDIEGDGVRCTLSFAKQPFQCVMPWTAIWTLVGKHDGRGYQWVEDMPPEMVAIPQPPPPPAMGPRLRAVSAVPKNDETGDEASESTETTSDKGERPGESDDAAPVEKSEPAVAEPARTDEPPAGERSGEEKTDEDDESARPGGKKKRALPSYLRVIK